MNRQVFLPLLRRSVSVRAAVFIAFLLSGLLHEFAISYPAGAGFGGPLLYFLIQGVACMVESRLVGGTTSGVRRIWTWTVLLLPAPLLFTPSFLQAGVEPLFSEVHQIGASVGATQLLDKSLWFAAAGNLLTMAAGIQVPKRLNWKEELSKLTPFNRKVFLNYYAFTGGVIGAWALLTLGMHYELLAGNRVAGLVALVIALFWGARVAVDTFYFKHDDWPPGSELVVGHALLTTLFVCLTCVYAFFAVWCLWLSH